jgi:hypothetical protein
MRVVANATHMPLTTVVQSLPRAGIRWALRAGGVRRLVGPRAMSEVVNACMHACMHVRANGQQHLYCGCTVSAGGFANISISSARVRWTEVNDNRS